MDLMDDPYLDQLIINRELGEKSEWIYRHNIGIYCELIGLTPEELINEAVNEDNLHPSRKKIRLYLTKWKDYLTNSHYAPNSQKKMFDHVRYFYQEFEIKLPKKITMKVEEEEDIDIDDLPTVEDLRLAHNNTNLRTQAIILLMCSSGLSKLDVRGIKYNDFLISVEDYYKPAPGDELDIDKLIENLQGKEIVGTWKGNRGKKAKGKKKGAKYITFHTPETTRAILSYLKTDKPLGLNDFLFRYKGRQITEKAWDKYFNLLNKRCRFGKVGNESYIASHNFRRRFLTLLAENEVDFIRAELMGGHLLPKTQRSYYKTLTVGTMKKTYLEVMPELCIVDKIETRVLTSDDKAEFERMKERERQRELEQLEEKKAFEERMEKMERIIDDMKRKEKLD